MSDDDAAVPPELPLFTPAQIAVASMIGGPLPACWFFACNYAAFGQAKQRSQCLAWGIGGTVALLVVGFFLPDNFPPLAVPVGYTIGLYHTARIILGTVVAAQLAAGARQGSWRLVVGLSLVVFVALLIVLLGGSMLVQPEA